MSEVKNKELLLINMEYSQNEINEPINIDILLECLPDGVFDELNITVFYRDLDSLHPIDSEKYDIILISSKLSSFASLDCLLNLYRGKIVIVGGILAICAGEELASMYPDVIFCTGEGETNLSILLHLAYNSDNIDEFKQSIVEFGIPNVCFHSESTHNIISTNRLVYDLALAKYPKHNKLQDVSSRNGLVRMETSRGCPWNKCSFCIMPWKFCGKAWRSFSKEKIQDEIEFLIQNGATSILFTDEDFIGSYEHIVELCEIIEHCKSAHNKEVSFGGSTSIMTLRTLGENLDCCLRSMKRAGINFLFIGIESGCDSQLKRFNKGVTVAHNEEIINKLRQYDFEIDFGFILFDADTTIIELEENLNFINRTGLRSSISRFAKKLRITPHTAIYNEYKEKGILDSELDIDNLAYMYKFSDPNIELVCSFIDRLDEHVLEETYKLQAVMRSAVTQDEKDCSYTRLLQLREYGYSFLRSCIDRYKQTGRLCYEDVLTLYHNVFL